MSTTIYKEATIGGPTGNLQAQAAHTALEQYGEESKGTDASSVLDENGKLSSASAATSLKYARAQDLPSFPSAGLKMASAGAAASLADSNKKPFEHWKPNNIPAANKAALLAKDYEMDPLWEPELSKAGSKAASIAQRETPEVNVYRAEGTKQGHSAASIALGMKQPGAITNRDVSANDRRKALLAATASMKAGRNRAGSAPQQPMGNAAWALKAANSTKPGQGEFAPGDPGFEAARIQNIGKNVNRQMYGSTPPVAIEVEERNRQAMLRASAVAMAQKMYAIQQAHIDDAKATKQSTGRRGRNRALSESSGDENAGPHPYENLEEAARRLAAARLAKLHDEHAEYRQYYGQDPPTTRNRMSLRARRRTSADEDEEEARRIGAEMSIFKNKLAEVDTKQRQADRDALLATAHRNVTQRLNALDDKVFQETGKASPRQMELWEQQAREKAQKDSDDRMVNHGKVHIGGGKYLDQSEVDAIARARLQPTLDEISAKAEAQRARDEEIRLEQERLRAEQEKEKQRLAAVRAEQKATEAEEKRLRTQQSDAEKLKRTAAAAEERQRLKQEKDARRLAEGTGASGGRFTRIFGAGTGAGTKVATPGENAGEAAALPVAVEAATGEVVVAEGATVHDAVTVQNIHESVTVQSDGPFEPTEGFKYATPGPVEGGPVETVELEKTHDDTVAPDEDDAPFEPALDIPVEIDPVEAEEKVREAEVTIPATLTSHPPNTTQATSVTPAAPATPTTPASPISPSKRDSKVSSWFKTRFRSGSKTQKDLETPALTGASTTAPANTPAVASAADDNIVGSESERDVALAGRSNVNESDDMYGPGTTEDAISPVHDTGAANFASEATAGLAKSPSISSLSSYSQRGASSVAYSQQPSVTARPGTSTSDHAVESESEQRGRKGFRQRLLGRITATSGKHDKPKEVAQPAVPTTNHTTQPQSTSEATTENPAVTSMANPASNDAYAAVTMPQETHNGDAIQQTQQTAVTQDDDDDDGPLSPGDDDDFEEARDTFEEETLAPPPKHSSTNTAGSPNARDRSRFTEEL